MRWALVLAALAAAGAAAAQQGNQPHPGRVAFESKCAPCHGRGPGDDRSAMLPGTAALERKYAGRLPSALELRTDLPAPVLRLFVRQGVNAMPAFRPSELSDAEITAIADYLALPD